MLYAYRVIICTKQYDTYLFRANTKTAHGPRQLGSEPLMVIPSDMCVYVQCMPGTCLTTSYVLVVSRPIGCCVPA